MRISTHLPLICALLVFTLLGLSAAGVFSADPEEPPAPSKPKTPLEAPPELIGTEDPVIGHEEVQDEVVVGPDVTLPTPAQLPREDELTRIGTCRLEIALRTAAGEVALDEPVELWRLDLPETDRFTAGDERIGSSKPDENGTVVFAAIAPGTYRIQALGQRADTDDPRAFEVTGKTTRKTFDVPGRRNHRVYLRVFDRSGAVISEGETHKSGKSFHDTGSHPSWARIRHEKREDGTIGIGIGGFGAGFSGCGGFMKQTLAANGRGFDLGLHPEDKQRASVKTRLRMTFKDQSEVRFSIAADVQRERTYLSVVVPVVSVHDRVRLPSGERAVDEGADIRIFSAPVLETDETLADAWRRIPIKVEVRLPGYEKLTYEFTLEDGHDVDRVLVPVGASD